jgi:hypothetical protein
MLFEERLGGEERRLMHLVPAQGRVMLCSTEHQELTQTEVNRRLTLKMNGKMIENERKIAVR